MVWWAKVGFGVLSSDWKGWSWDGGPAQCYSPVDRVDINTADQLHLVFRIFYGCDVVTWDTWDVLIL